MSEISFQSDEEAQQYLKDISPIWQMLKDKEAEIAQAKAAAEKQFNEQHADAFEMINVLRAKIDEAYIAFNEYLNAQTLATGRKRFLEGRITTRIVRYAGPYDPVALRVWARKYSDTLRPTTDKEKKLQVVETLLRTAPELLEVDDKAAEKLAIQVYEDGSPMFEDSPVPIEVRATRTSEDMFNRLLGTYAIEREFDARQE